MLIASSLLALFRRVDRAASERLTQQQLQRLDAHLLRDIGFIHHDGRIVPLQGDCRELPEAPTTRQPPQFSAPQSLHTGGVDTTLPPPVSVT
ncbi:MAG TPA: hypothetical protein VIS52_04910 [Motiliproteus sp.]